MVQGELQGAMAGLSSVSSIVGPPLMSQVFGRFSAPDAPVHAPGAAFLVSGALAAACGIVYFRATRAGPALVGAADPRYSAVMSETDPGSS